MRELVGRAAERRALHDALTSARAGGVRVVLHGEPGIGKTSLLDDLVATARAEGVLALRCVGVPSETHVPYAALHQLLQPLLTEPAPDARTALVRRVVGAVATRDDPTGPAPEPVAVALATLDLLRERAAATPLLLGVEDVQWLDASSALVLAFVARRIDDDPVLLACSSREPLHPPLDDVLFLPVDLAPLDEDAAAVLARHAAPDLHPVLRDRLLTEAQGNPLAIVELARAWRRLPDGALVTSPVPVTARVEAAFAARVDGLPADCRTLLLLAALHPVDGRTGELVAAARALGHDVRDTLALTPAVDAGLVAVAPHAVTFRHPLVRAAVHSRAGTAARRDAHAALAGVTTDVDRAAWHRAWAATAPDETVAGALESSADRARRRGAVLESVATLELAAAHTPDPAVRGRRLVRAAFHASDVGHDAALARLLDEADVLPLAESDRARATWLRYRPQDAVGDFERMSRLVEVLGDLHAAGQAEAALDSLAPAADIAFWRGVEPRCRDLFCGAVERLTSTPDPRLLAALALTAPVSRSQTVRLGVAALGAGSITDAEALALAGRAASVVGDVGGGTALLGRAIRPLHTQGRLGLLTASLVTYAWNCWHLGRWADAAVAAEEVRDVGRARERPLVSAVLVESLLLAVRGDGDEALRAWGSTQDAVAATGSPTLTAVATCARATALLVLDRVDEAYEALRPGFEDVDHDRRPESVASLHHGILPLYADAARRAGREAAARAAVEPLRATLRQHGSPLLAASVSYADAVLAPEDDAEPLLRAAGDDLAGWPFLRARARLAHGRWLRRQRRVAESRAVLRAARDGFDALGAVPWSQAARQELRAAGESVAGSTASSLALLTAQEREIVALAAQGLTNREIGNRLYLSPRTVGSHLYHVFPKLGVASRSELARALDDGRGGGAGAG
ncbi:helix-turn-helix transcriptional regulator [Cellulosimicrobium protaetiae]|uniref:AAA family ATPase n=1 Tax=Cellulosimicrobium protaetiae TaxID=2587808 RepID=A0A6M5UD95_9MICO|nr:AAA family ATPase [Cellulosimicrobium protaetiae]QJW35165.1 AAA family ATPase [Cellulosimicrobium protaetiae]